VVCAGWGRNNSHPALWLFPNDELNSAVFCPCFFIVADYGRFVFAVADGLHPVEADAEGFDIPLRSQGPFLGERQVIFIRTPFVGMTFDDYTSALVFSQPAGIAAEGIPSFRSKQIRVEVEVNRVEISLAL